MSDPVTVARRGGARVGQKGAAGAARALSEVLQGRSNAGRGTGREKERELLEKRGKAQASRSDRSLRISGSRIRLDAVLLELLHDSWIRFS